MPSYEDRYTEYPKYAHKGTRGWLTRITTFRGGVFASFMDFGERGISCAYTGSGHYVSNVDFEDCVFYRDVNDNVTYGGCTFKNCKFYDTWGY